MAETDDVISVVNITQIISMMWRLSFRCTVCMINAVITHAMIVLSYDDFQTTMAFEKYKSNIGATVLSDTSTTMAVRGGGGLTSPLTNWL